MSHNVSSEPRDTSVAFQQRFTSMVSHELRTPLTLVIGLAELLITRWDDLDRDAALPYLHSLASAANRQKLLLDDLLDLSRILEGRVTEVPTRPSSVRRVIDAALELLPDQAADVRVDVDESLRWCCDELRTSQAVVNLLGNARKYGRPPVEITAERSAEMVRLRVRDHGKGVPSEFERNLFERFSQADDHERSDDGVGLGLHIVHWFLDVQGGTLWHERPADGEGAVFVIELPAVDDDADSAGC